MSRHGQCPKCFADMQGGKIPYNIVEHYIPLNVDKDEWLANNEWPTWGRALGIEIRGAYDGILIWRCPDCGHNWPRFSKEDWETLHNRAVRIIRDWETNRELS